MRVVAKTKLPHGDDHMVTLVCDCIRDKGVDDVSGEILDPEANRTF